MLWCLLFCFVSQSMYRSGSLGTEGILLPRMNSFTVLPIKATLTTGQYLGREAYIPTLVEWCGDFKGHFKLVWERYGVLGGKKSKEGVFKELKDMSESKGIYNCDVKLHGVTRKITIIYRNALSAFDDSPADQYLKKVADELALQCRCYQLKNMPSFDGEIRQKECCCVTACLGCVDWISQCCGTKQYRSGEEEEHYIEMKVQAIMERERELEKQRLENRQKEPKQSWMPNWMKKAVTGLYCCFGCCCYELAWGAVVNNAAEASEVASKVEPIHDIQQTGTAIQRVMADDRHCSATMTDPNLQYAAQKAAEGIAYGSVVGTLASRRNSQVPNSPNFLQISYNRVGDKVFNDITVTNDRRPSYYALI